MAENINLSQPLTKPQKKRVLFIITQSEMGGAQRFVLELVKGLRQRPHDILVAVGSDGGGVFMDEVDKLNIGVKVLSRLRRNPNPISDLLAIWQIKKLIQSWKPQTVFLNSSKAGFIGSLASQLISPAKRPRIIYRIGGWTFNDPWSIWARKSWIILERLSAKWKDIIIVNNKHDFIQARELRINPRKEIVLIHNGFDPFKLSLLPRDEARAKLGIKALNVVGTIANLYPAKGLSHLVRAAEMNTDSDTVFVIIGEGSERKLLEKEIRERKLANKVLLVGSVPEARQYLSAFDIFVLPSVKEGFPWGILEAMSARLPVIATSVGAVPEVIESGVSGYVVPPADPSALAEKIALLTHNKHLAEAMVIKAHQTVILRFSLARMFSQIETLL